MRTPSLRVKLAFRFMLPSIINVTDTKKQNLPKWIKILLSQPRIWPNAEPLKRSSCFVTGHNMIDGSAKQIFPTIYLNFLIRMLLVLARALDTWDRGMNVTKYSLSIVGLHVTKKELLHSQANVWVQREKSVPTQIMNCATTPSLPNVNI